MNGLLYYCCLAIAVLIITSSIYALAEKVDFATAMWWSSTTATTVGYGDISPHTGLGKFAAVTDMLIGVGLIGMLTSSLTNLFNQNDKDSLEEEIKQLHQENQQLMNELHKIQKQLTQESNHQKVNLRVI